MLLMLFFITPIALKYKEKNLEKYEAINHKKTLELVFKYLQNNASNSLAEWLKDLSTKEKERVEKFGYKNN